MKNWQRKNLKTGLSNLANNSTGCMINHTAKKHVEQMVTAKMFGEDKRYRTKIIPNKRNTCFTRKGILG